MDIKKRDEIIAKRLEIVKTSIRYGTTEAAKILGLSRKTILKWKTRFKESGLNGLYQKEKRKSAHPAAMPIDLENKIIHLKKKNKMFTASQIKKELNLNFSVNTILKKIKNADIETAKDTSFMSTKNTPFMSTMTINIQKINTGGDLPPYIITALDYNSKILISSFTYEKISLNIAIFLHYILSFIENAGYKNKISIITFKKDLIQNYKKKKSILRTICDKFNINFAFVEDKSINKKLNDNDLEYFFENNQFHDEYDLLKKTFSHILIKNIDKIKNKRVNLKQNKIIALSPIITDKYISLIPNISIIEYEKHILNLKRYTIQYLMSEALKLRNNSENENSITLLEKLLMLCSDKITVATILINIGEANENIGSFKKSFEFYNNAIKIASNVDNDKTLLNGINHIAELHSILGNYTKSFEFYNKGLNLAKKSGSKDNLINSYNKLGMGNYYSLNFSAAIKYFNKALDICKKCTQCDNFKNYINTLLGFSVANIKLGNKTKGYNYFQKASLIKSEKSPNLIMNHIIKFGDLYINMDNFLDKYYTKILNSVNFKNKKLAIGALERLGTIHLIKEEFEKALHFYQRGLLIAEEIKYEFKISSISINLGNVYWYKTNYSNALSSFKRALKIANKLRIHRIIAMSKLNIGCIYSNKNDIVNANKYYIEALNFSKKYNFTKMNSIILFDIGSLNYGIEEFETALKYFKKHLLIAKKIKDHRNIFLSYNNIGKSYQELGKYKGAMQNFNNALYIAESMNSNYFLCEILYNKAFLQFEIKQKSSSIPKLLIAALSHAKKSNRKDIVSLIKDLESKI